MDLHSDNNPPDFGGADLRGAHEPAPCRASKRNLLFFIPIVLIGLMAYSNTFHAPFQWDEKEFIESNPIVKDLSYFVEPSKAEGLKHYGDLRRRYVGYLTFALNYRLGGLDVTGYHVFNFVVHLLNSLLIFVLLKATFRTPFLRETPLSRHSSLMALFSALMFVTHPVETEAVTYIFQRLASLVAFFYLLSIVMYALWRLSNLGGRRHAAHRLLYFASLASAVLAMKTKENAFTLPAALALYEFLFFSGPLRRRALFLLPHAATMLIVPLALAAGGGGEGFWLMGGGGMPKWDYLFTELRVIVTYLRLLFIPMRQNIDYDYPIYGSFFNAEVFLSFLVFVFMLGIALGLYYRLRHKSPASRLIAFGIFWFYLTLSVESTIIPLYMVIDEYRVYLPSAGFFMALTTAIFLLLSRLPAGRLRTAATGSLIVIPLVFSYATHLRNNVWGSEISLWEDVVRKSPHRARGHYNLANNYASSGLIENAIVQYEAAIDLNPNYADANNNLGILLDSRGSLDAAIERFEAALRADPRYVEAHNNLGTAYWKKGLFDRAIEHYRLALMLRPDAELYHNMGVAHASKGMTEKSVEYYLAALRLNPAFIEAHNNLSLAYRNLGLDGKAEEHADIAQRLRRAQRLREAESLGGPESLGGSVPSTDSP